MKKILAAGFLVVALLSIPSTGFSVTYYVPDDYGTIQTALDGATGGDTIIVRDGIYAGEGNTNIDFKGKAVILRSENGPENCIIDCQNSSRGFYFHSREDKLSVVKGLTIRNGSGARLGRDWAGTDPTVGGAIFCFESAPSIVDNIFIQNSAELGGAICCFRSPSPVISRNKIESNRAKLYHGGGVYLNQCQGGIIEDNVLAKNEAKFAGGAISLQRGSSPLIQRNTIKGNMARGGGAICISNGAPTISNNLIVGNKSVGTTNGPYGFDGGGAIILWGAPILAINNNFISNSAEVRGGAIAIAYTKNARFFNNIFWNNTAPAGKNIYLAYYQSSTEHESTITVKHCLLQDGTQSCHVEEGCFLTEEDNFESPPLFVDIGQDDYQLSANSPCIDSGMFNKKHTIDILGTTRPKGSGFDIGAYEY